MRRLAIAELLDRMEGRAVQLQITVDVGAGTLSFKELCAKLERKLGLTQADHDKWAQAQEIYSRLEAGQVWLTT